MFFFFFFYFCLILAVLNLLDRRSWLHWSWRTPPELHEKLYRVCRLQFGGAHSEMMMHKPLNFQCGSTFYKKRTWRVWLEDYICESVNSPPGAQEVWKAEEDVTVQGQATCTVWQSNELIFMISSCLKICDLIILGKGNPWRERSISQLNPHLPHKQRIRMNLELRFQSILSGSVGLGGHPS